MPGVHTNAFPDATRDGYVLYDGTCGFCGRWVPKWAPVLERMGLGTAALQADWVSGATGIPEEQLLEDIHIVLRDGTIFRGADAYRYILRQRWWSYPGYLLALLPGIKQLFDAAYRAFADRRYRISQACRLEPPLNPPGSGKP